MNKPTALALCLSLLAPFAIADHDGDPFPDNTESVACATPLVATTLPMLPPVAGRCVGGDYVNPLAQASGPCSGCSVREVFSQEGIPIAPSHDVESVPLPPQPVPGLGPFQTPPVEQGVATLQGFPDPQDPERYCLQVTSEESPVPVCVDVGPLGDFMPPFGPVTLVEIDSETVGPTPGVDDGQFGSTPPQRTPALSADLAVSMSWDPSHFNARLTAGDQTLWDPVDFDDPDELLWWFNNPAETGFGIVVTVYQDDEPMAPVGVVVPFVGQAYAAYEASLEA